MFLLGFSCSLSYAIIPNIPDKLSVKISYPSFNHEVPPGELPVFGTSSDNEFSLCEVYLDWNNDNAFHQGLEQQVQTDIVTFQHGYTCTARKAI